MRLMQPGPTQAEAGLRAMRQLALARGEFGAASRALIDAAQRQVLHTDFDIDTLPPISPEELAAAFHDVPPLARQFVQGMTVASLADGPPTEAQARLMSTYARALGLDEPAVRVLKELANHHMTLFKLDFMRRSHIADMLKGAARRDGFVKSARQFAAFRGVGENPALTARYRAWEKLPKDTLGYAFWKHYTDNGFTFPGAHFGFPEAGLYHDFTHVLSGYSTQPEGEVQVGGFVAGFKQHTPIFMILFVILTFSAGTNVTPVDQPVSFGILAKEGLADAFFVAVERGSRLPIDLSEGWDHWAWVEKPLDRARAELNIAPL
jgi:hypothetical protein